MKLNSRIVLLFAAMLAGAGALHAQVQVGIIDTLRNSDGTNASGSMIISWSPFTTAAGVTIDGGTKTYTVTAGVVNFTLTPNTGATPAGTSYTARYYLTNGASYFETWVVPSSGPVTIGAIRVSTVPSPTVLFNPLSQLYAGTLLRGDLLVGSATAGYLGRLAIGTNGQCLTSNGTTAAWGSCASGSGITSLNGLLGTTQTFSVPGTTGTAPAWVSSGTAHTLNIPLASAAGVTAGLLSKTDYDIFTANESALTFGTGLSRSVNAVTCLTASGSQLGCLAAADWTAFNAKESALTFSTPLSRSVNTISIPVATSIANGYLSSTDWSTFNGKAASNASTTVNLQTCALGGSCTVTASPTAHASTHGSAGSDAVSIANTQVSGLGGAAVLSVGTSAGTVAAGDDSRMTNARTPTAHVASHQENGSDEILGETLGTVCTENQILKADATGGLVCAADATGGAPTFDQIGGGTNTAGALVVGSGGSLRTAAGIIGLPNTTSLPGTCTVGDVHFDNNASSGSLIGLCTATNTWSLVDNPFGAAIDASEVAADVATQAELDLKAPLASPTFTGTATLPTPFTLGAVSVLPTGTELNFVDGVTSAIQTQLDAKQSSLGFTPENAANKDAASGYAGLSAGSLLSAAQLPLPAPTTLGGIKSLTCGSTDKLSALGTDGVPVCSADSGMAIGGTVTSGTAGAILAVNTGPVLAQAPTLLFWDFTLDRFGVGNNTPQALFSVGTSSGFQVNAAGDVMMNNATGTGTEFLSYTGTAPTDGNMPVFDGFGNLTDSGTVPGIVASVSLGNFAGMFTTSNGGSAADPSFTFTLATDMDLETAGYRYFIPPSVVTPSHTVLGACEWGTTNQHFWCYNGTAMVYALFNTDVSSSPPDGVVAADTAVPPVFSRAFNTNAKSSTYQSLVADFRACKTIPVASGTFTITLVASGSQPPSGQCISIVNYGSGVVTVARSGQNINGGTTSLTIPAGTATAPMAAWIVSDGTNYFASQSGGTVTSVSGTANQIASTGGTTPTLSIPTNPTLPGTTTGTFSGNLTGNVTGNTSGTAATITGAIVEANTPLTTKGDLLVEDGTTLHRLGVGTDGYVLTADAVSTDGVKWAAAAGGAVTSVFGLTGAVVPNANLLSYPVFANAGSGTDTYTTNLDPVPPVYAAGTLYGFKADVSNTGAASINFNGLGALTIKKLTQGSLTTDLATNDIRATEYVRCIYDGTNCMLMNEPANVKPVAAGGTGLASGTSGGILAYTASGTLASSGALTANLPVIGGGAGVAPTVGTSSGNTTKFTTMDGSSPATDDCVKWDANDNLTTAGAACAPLASPTFTGTVTIPTPFTLGAVSVLPTGTELNFVDGVTSAIQTQLNAKQATLTGTGLARNTGAATELSGDATTSGSNAVTVVKVNGITVTGTPAIGDRLMATSTTAAVWSSPILDYQKDLSAIAGDTTDKTLFTYPLPSGTLLAGRCIRVTASHIRSTGSTSTVYKFFFGATSTTTATTTSVANGVIQATICNDPGSTTNQQLTVMGSPGLYGAAIPYASPAEDTNSGTPINIKVTFNVASDQMIPISWLVERL